MVSTPLKSISQNGNLPQIEVKIKMFETTTQIPILLRSQLPSHTKKKQLLRGEIPNSARCWVPQIYPSDGRPVLSIKRSGLKVSSGRWWLQQHFLSLQLELPSGKRSHSNGKWTLWRCISYWKWGFSMAMLVYQRVFVDLLHRFPQCSMGRFFLQTPPFGSPWKKCGHVSPSMYR